MRDVDAHTNLAGVNPAAARSFKMRNTGMTLRLGAISLLAATGLAGGCSYDQNSEWSTTPAEAKPLAKAQRQNPNQSDDTYQITMMNEQESPCSSSPRPRTSPRAMSSARATRSISSGRSTAAR